MTSAGIYSGSGSNSVKWLDNTNPTAIASSTYVPSPGSIVPLPDGDLNAKYVFNTTLPIEKTYIGNSWAGTSNVQQRICETTALKRFDYIRICNFNSLDVQATNWGAKNVKIYVLLEASDIYNQSLKGAVKIFDGQLPQSVDDIEASYYNYLKRYYYVPMLMSNVYGRYIAMDIIDNYGDSIRVGLKKIQYGIGSASNAAIRFDSSILTSMKDNNGYSVGIVGVNTNILLSEIISTNTLHSYDITGKNIYYTDSGNGVSQLGLLPNASGLLSLPLQGIVSINDVWIISVVNFYNTPSSTDLLGICPLTTVGNQTYSLSCICISSQLYVNININTNGVIESNNVYLMPLPALQTKIIIAMKVKNITNGIRVTYINEDGLFVNTSFTSNALITDGPDCHTVIRSFDNNAVSPCKLFDFSLNDCSDDNIQSYLFNIKDKWNIYKNNEITLSLYNNLKAVFSFKRIIYNYTGPIFRIRRSSDNSEIDMYGKSDGGLNEKPTMDGMSYVSWLNGSIGYVVRWYDQKNGSYAQNTSDITRQPIIDITDPNNRFVDLKPNRFLEMQSYVVPLGNSPYTVSLKHKKVNDLNTTHMIWLGGSEEFLYSNCALIVAGGGVYRHIWLGSRLDIGSYADNSVVSATYNPTTNERKGYVNKQLLSTDYPTVTRNGRDIYRTIGYYSNSDFEIFHLFVSHQVLSNEERLIIESF